MPEEPIARAAREVLLAEGYRGFDVDAVAARAGVDPASVGRGDVDLLVDVLATGLAAPPVPDLGDSAAELGFMIRALGDRQRFHAALLALTADRVHDQQAARTLADRCLALSRANLAVVLRRAAGRGDLPPDADLDLIHDVVAGAIAYRHVVAGRDSTAAFAQQLVDMLLRGMAPLRDAPPAADAPVGPDRPGWLDELSWWLDGPAFGALLPSGGAPVGELAAVPAEAVVDGHPHRGRARQHASRRRQWTDARRGSRDRCAGRA